MDSVSQWMGTRVISAAATMSGSTTHLWSLAITVQLMTKESVGLPKKKI